MSYTRAIYHIIFRTKSGIPAITEEYETILYSFIWKFITQRKSVLYRINGMPDHIHLLVDLHPKIAVADFVQQLKNATHLLLERHKAEFPLFSAWAVGYCALTYSERDKPQILNYIKNQKKHHQQKYKTFSDEIKFLMSENGIAIDEQFFERNI
ncbi:IS200/IS605 family transposase [Mannheimia sp. AT1]|uniref:IS200/IS605 family transposase n=1 Tax=Mannheimia cairinae TaxID=3025936 RepID=A0ABT5MSQ0_9PAST|nr:IS200/IS605 family transposase [Mannheimia cairinae]MDD0824983.1 IS200/IS605 family transposase [Mannheimia cairinae]MDD0827221.1 IS200/IS605 family transposase [Mannheimia cairinae]